MITPVQKAPKAFAERYNNIVDGKEIIDTVAKLKEFWVFGIAEGANNREMREYIAELMIAVPTTEVITWTIFSECLLHQAYIQIETFTSIGDSPNPNETDEQYHDRLWENLNHFYIEPIEEKKIDSVLKNHLNDNLTSKKLLKIFDYSHKNSHCTHHR